MGDIHQLISVSKVIPVVTLARPKDALNIAEVLFSEGISIMEITFRSTHALRGIELVRSHLPDICVGAGTVWQKQQLQAAMRSGAQFAVSPGVTEELMILSRQSEVPMLLGAQTISEVARLREAGHQVVKFFPAEYAGGIAVVNAIATVLPDVLLCPTGGLSGETAKAYLSQGNVACVGGSWMLPNDLVQRGNWRGVARYVRTQVDWLRQSS